MTKIILNTYLKTATESKSSKNMNGILKEKHLLFKEDDYTVNIIFLKNTITMTRKKEGQEIKINLKNNEKSNIEYTINNLKFNIPIITKQSLKKENSIIINYQIIDTKQDIYYEINYKKWEA